MDFSPFKTDTQKLHLSGPQISRGQGIALYTPNHFPIIHWGKQPLSIVDIIFVTLQSLVRHMLNGMCQGQQGIIHYEQKNGFLYTPLKYTFKNTCRYKKPLPRSLFDVMC